jgi:hypothetical protein
MNLQIADLEMNNLLDRDAMGALMGGSITVLSPWQTISSQSSYGNYANGSYFNLKKSVFGFTVIYGKKRYEYRTKTTVARQKRSRSVLF